MDFFFYHNTDTCVGCRACQIACKDRNNLQPGEFFRRVSEVQLPADGKIVFYSAACNHCENPMCIAACPNEGFYKAEDGTVLHDDGKCIGCGKCMWACPYGAISLSKEKGIAQKCDGCYDRRQQGMEPACVAACINHSLQWGRTDGRQSAELTAELPGVLPDPQITDPKTRIHSSVMTKE